MSAPTPRLMLADAAVVVVLGLLAASPLADAYGGWRWAAATGVGLLLGLAVAATSRRFDWGPWLTALILVCGYLLLGAALAVPDHAVGGVLPGAEALRALGTGAIHAWRDSLTLLTPLGSTGTVLVVPWILGLVAGVSAGTLLWRGRWPGAAPLVLIAVLVVAVAFGSRDSGLPLPRGLALTLSLLVWQRWRATRGARVAWPRRLLLTAVVAVIAGALGTGLTAATAGGSREVLRDHVQPPFDPLDYPSPLSRYRAFYDEATLGDRTMFTTTGLAPGDRVRLATMDTFDGVVWNVAGGPEAPTQSGSFGRLADTETAEATRVSVAIADYSGPWVPTVGETRAVTVTRDGHDDAAARAGLVYNDATGTMAQLGGVQPGTTYEFEVVRPAVPAAPASLDAEGGPGVNPPADIQPLTKRVQQWTAQAGGPTGGALAQLLVDQFRQGFYSDGKPGQAPSASGHGVRRLTDLAGAEQLIGNDEQYASAMAVVAQQRGLPARVVMGFVLEDPAGVVKGKDVHAWVEIKLAGAGWVPFAPTPDKDRTPKQEQSDPEPEPQPNVLQPPVVPEEPDDDDEKAPQGAGRKSRDESASGVGSVLRYLGYGAVGVGITSPVWLLLLAKGLRRRRRRRAPDPVRRISGGWHEVADRARDLGVRLPRGNTRYENGARLAERYHSPELTTVALVADRHVFGAGTPTDAEVDAYWSDVRTALVRLRKGAPWWRRPLALLSPASLPWAALAERARDVLPRAVRSRGIRQKGNR
ncbi:transglutaminase domain-containing protein [Nocardioides sp.]|uniref:transglutaminase family protein n=1 Tax=Nocardioides sp. TaxID=35761 RepID=UPI0039E34CC9